MNMMSKVVTIPGVALAAAMALTQTAAANGPDRGWAERAGLTDPQPNSIELKNDNALDRLKIQETFARWAIGFDEGKVNIIDSLFTDDADFSTVLGSNGAQVAKAHGRAAIVTNVDAAIKQEGDQLRHAMSNILIDKLTQHEATAIAYAIVVAPADHMKVVATVIYRADLVKGADKIWRFSKFVIGMDEYAGAIPVHPPAPH